MNRTSRPRNATPGRVRIIAGTLRNSRLEVLDLPGLRPTAERIRETLFNWLQHDVVGARCLDLFAGTGALGIEAASRGAREVVLVERDPRAAQVIAANLARLKVPQARVETRAAEVFLAQSGEAFDLAFVDPPFSADVWGRACAALEASGLLAAKAQVYVESPRDVDPLVPTNWMAHRTGTAGDVRYALYWRNSGGQSAD